MKAEEADAAIRAWMDDEQKRIISSQISNKTDSTFRSDLGETKEESNDYKTLVLEQSSIGLLGLDYSEATSLSQTTSETYRDFLVPVAWPLDIKSELEDRKPHQIITKKRRVVVRRPSSSWCLDSVKSEDKPVKHEVKIKTEPTESNDDLSDEQSSGEELVEMIRVSLSCLQFRVFSDTLIRVQVHG